MLFLRIFLFVQLVEKNELIMVILLKKIILQKEKARLKKKKLLAKRWVLLITKSSFDWHKVKGSEHSMKIELTIQK